MSMKKPQLGMSARKTVGNTVYHIFMVVLSVIMINCRLLTFENR